VNAVILADGWAAGGADGARSALERFWRAVASTLPTALVQSGDSAGEAPQWAPWAEAWMQAWQQTTRWLAPEQLNPLNINPLREVLRDQIDFERLSNTTGMGLFIAATHAPTGQLRLFRRHEIHLDALLASTCLPTLMPAVHINGQSYWDGGFCANPPLWPLLRQVQADDLLLVTLSPLSPQAMPHTGPDIESRLREISMTAPFLLEARMLAEQQADARRRWWRWGWDRRLARLRWHHIGGDEALASFPGSSRLLPEENFLLALRNLGCEHAAQWLDQHGAALGHRSSFDALACFASNTV
jgi:NTE family protein